MLASMASQTSQTLLRGSSPRTQRTNTELDQNVEAAFTLT